MNERGRREQRVLVAVERCKAGRVRVRRTSDARVVSLLLVVRDVVRPVSLVLTDARGGYIAKRESSDWRGRRLAERCVLAVGICEDAGVLYALLRVAGQPYRDPAYLAVVAHGQSVGMDAAPTDPAFVGEADGFIGTLASPAACERQRKLDQQARRLQRAHDCSRLVMNPDCYDEAGRVIKGKCSKRASATYRRRQGRLRKLQRRATVQRSTDAEALTRKVMMLGTRVAVEKTSVRLHGGAGRLPGNRGRPRRDRFYRSGRPPAFAPEEKRGASSA